LQCSVIVGSTNELTTFSIYRNKEYGCDTLSRMARWLNCLLYNCYLGWFVQVVYYLLVMSVMGIVVVSSKKYKWITTSMVIYIPESMWELVCSVWLVM
jgi:hypothetical protein